jgi:TetR/AcrR family transcriptional regulator
MLRAATPSARSAAGRDSREQVFRAAAAEFAERGFEAAGVDRIAAKAKVNKAMIYYHFGSKLALYVEVLRDMFRAVGTRARALADAPADPREKLDAWVAMIVEEASARPWFPPIMLRELASGVPHFDPETLELMGVVANAWRDIIASGQESGALRREADPLLTHLTVMPAVLVFFVREQALAAKAARRRSTLMAPRSRAQFIQHMQHAVRGMLRKD